MFTLGIPLFAVMMAFLQKEFLPREQDAFSLGVEILSALESGPLVVKLTLRYRGAKSIHIQPGEPRYDSLERVHPPPAWTLRRRSRFFIETGSTITSRWDSSNPPFAQLQPGTALSRVYYLHHDYEQIPAGPARLCIDWPVYAASKRAVKAGKAQRVQGALLAKPSTTIAVNVPHATPASIRALRQQLERELAACTLLPEGRDLSSNPRHEQTNHLAETLRYCPHESLFPLVINLIALPDSNLVLNQLIQHVYDASASLPKAHALFRDYLLGSDPAHATAIFSFWEDLQRSASMSWQSLPRPQKLAVALVGFLFNPSPSLHNLDFFISDCKAYRRLLPKGEVERLKQAQNVWVRALTWVTFPRWCEERWMEKLKADLRRLNRPLPAAKFQRLLGQLDSPRFAVRERAAAQLLRVGDGVAPALRNVLKRPLELELRRRIQRLLADIDRGVHDPLRGETLAYLASRETPEARAVLQTLAEGLPQARLTKAAAAALKPPKEHRPPQTNPSGQLPLPPGLTPPPGPKPPKAKPFPGKERR